MPSVEASPAELLVAHAKRHSQLRLVAAWELTREHRGILYSEAAGRQLFILFYIPVGFYTEVSLYLPLSLVILGLLLFFGYSYTPCYMRNSLLNITSRVPPEILGYIFYWRALQRRHLPKIRQSSYHFLLVCRHWYLVASRTPELWSFWGHTLAKPSPRSIKKSYPLRAPQPSGPLGKRKARRDRKSVV